MKKSFALVLTLVLALVFASSALAETVTLNVGASPAPHAQILEFVKPILAEQGIELNIVEYNDYVIPNTAVESGELDANFFQHQLYLEDFNAKQGTHLVSVAAIHYEPFGIYAGKTADLASLADGATIAIPNDGTNEARALILLASQGLITLNDSENLSVTATKLDIAENPHNYDIQEVEAAQVPRSLQDVDIAVINGNYAIEAGLKLADALATEDGASDAIQNFYKNVLVVKEGNESNEAILALVEALQSDAVRSYIEETYAGAVVPLF